mgnify:CR=1 FL=1
MSEAIPPGLRAVPPAGDIRLAPDALVAMLVDAYAAGRASRLFDDAGRAATTPRVARAGGGRRG